MIAPSIAPTFHQIPFRILLGGITGALSAKIAGSSTRLWAQVSVITSVADSILYLGIIHLMKQTDKKFSYIFVHSLVSTIEILALRKLELINSQGTLIVGGYAILRCVILSRIREELF